MYSKESKGCYIRSIKGYEHIEKQGLMLEVVFELGLETEKAHVSSWKARPAIPLAGGDSESMRRRGQGSWARARAKGVENPAPTLLGSVTKFLSGEFNNKCNSGI